jgi:hypothetical protein
MAALYTRCVFMILAFPCRHVPFWTGIIFHVTPGTTGRFCGEEESCAAR